LSFDAAARILNVDCRGGREEQAVAVSLQDERPAWSGQTAAAEANEVADEGFRRPRKGVYAPDVLAALARGADDFSEDAGLVDLDLDNADWGF